MYGWLGENLADAAVQLVTANRRLARSLRLAYADQQLAAGAQAWCSPAIQAWQDWLAGLLLDAEYSEQLPLLLTAQQSRVLWEQCLRDELDEPFVNYSNLARQCRDTWQRLQEWRVPLSECAAAAQGQDQDTFARVAARYRKYLLDRNWIDQALLPARIIEMIETQRLATPAKLLPVGFDRYTPQFDALLTALLNTGTEILQVPERTAGKASVQKYDNSEGELRAAGNWARKQLTDNPDQKIAIVVAGLQQTAIRSAALIREGLVPGWQYGRPEFAAAVNVSYGSRLSTYPAIDVALHLLRWLFGTLRSVEVSLLLRSVYLGQMPIAGRSRLELYLRGLPDQQWSRELLGKALGGHDQSADSEDWLTRLDLVGTLVAATDRSMRPSAWAEFFDGVLEAFAWPGTATMSSADFQLDNRWRGLLNEFAGLELVCGELGGAEAVARLAGLAAETVFQPEREGAVVDVIGPLEAAGMEFDQLWVAGATAADWPPPARPLPLLARKLQVEFGMPDASPGDTADYARRVLARLQSSASACVFSYPAYVGDAEQLPSSLLPTTARASGDPDPGWGAAQLAGIASLIEVADRVPAVSGSEILSGGASTIDLQQSDPFAAFARGRLAVQQMSVITPGIPANLRGNLIHQSLFHFYRDLPTHRQICNWSEAQIALRINKSLDAAFASHERYADALLQRLYVLERERTAQLLRGVLELDRARVGFSISQLEVAVDTDIPPIRLRVRIDRVDQIAEGGQIILDYKTGVRKPLLSKSEPNSSQLVVYSMALPGPISGLGLFNVDSRETMIDSAGPALGETDDGDWHELLGRWQNEVSRRAAQIGRGDVRLNIKQKAADARALALLSRFAEVQRVE